MGLSGGLKPKRKHLVGLGMVKLNAHQFATYHTSPASSSCKSTSRRGVGQSTHGSAAKCGGKCFRSSSNTLSMVRLKANQRPFAS